MRYLPHTQVEIQAMLKAVGAETIGDLFDAIPEKFRLKEALDLPAALDERALIAHLRGLADKNRASTDLCFLGGGIYDHYSPVIVDQLLMRSEFYTAYTPYQPEIAQGTLQTIFEFQSMVATLLGMEIANASMWDGSTATMEAVTMAERVRQKGRVLVARSLNPHYRRVLDTSVASLGIELIDMPYTTTGQIDHEALHTLLSMPTSAVLIQHPNYFGVLEDLPAIAGPTHAAGALLVSSFTEALAFALVAPPGEGGADITAGEGQSLGLPMNLGGPVVGLFATAKEWMRQMPGRLAGMSVDSNGNPAYVLTMSTREQHIRRERATSNICTNQGLCALASTIYLATMGPHGLQRVAGINVENATVLRRRLAAIDGVTLPFDGPTFNEFVIQLARPIDEVLAALKQHGIVGGIEISRYFDDLADALLVTTTECHSATDLDRFVNALSAALS